MASCSGIKADGGRCRAQAITGGEWCFNHHPGYEEQRRRRASRGGKRGGRGRPMAELSELKGQLAALYAGVLAGTIEPKVGAVLAQITNGQIRLAEAALKAKEQLEMLQRVEELERLLAGRRDGRRGRWG